MKDKRTQRWLRRRCRGFARSKFKEKKENYESVKHHRRNCTYRPCNCAFPPAPSLPRMPDPREVLSRQRLFSYLLFRVALCSPSYSCRARTQTLNIAGASHNLYYAYQHQLGKALLITIRVLGLQNRNHLLPDARDHKTMFVWCRTKEHRGK
jgi:hypothetical protein